MTTHRKPAYCWADVAEESLTRMRWVEALKERADYDGEAGYYF